MPRKARKMSQYGYYHIVIKGNGGQILFEDTEDYRRLLSILDRYMEEESFEILAYCLMDNHVHLLIHAEHNLDRIMKRITCSYAFYFNAKYERTGHLFQDRFKSEPIEDDRYLMAVVRYIHNNPLKAGLSAREEYPWSSWFEYMGKASIVSTELVFSISGGRKGFIRLSESAKDIECMDISDKTHLSDRNAAILLNDLLGIADPFQLQKMDRKNRNAAIRVLKMQGLSVRQIERITGISRGIVLKA